MKLTLPVALATLAATMFACSQPEQKGLKDVWGHKYLIGTAVNQWQVAGETPIETAAILKHFNCVTAENCMKSEVINPEKGVFDFKLADEFMAFAEKNNLTVIGHSPIWHSQQAKWFCFDDNGELVCPDTLKQRIHDHIFTVMQRYKGKIKGYDVVNEAIEDDGSYRNSLMYQIMGEEFIDWAFQCAMEADPDAELYYNDYSMWQEGKRNTVCELVKRLKSKNIKIDAIGMQCHNGMDFPELSEFEASIQAFLNEGVRIQFTEFDMSILPNPYKGADVDTRFQYTPEKDPYRDGVPADVQAAWNARMREFFTIIDKYQDKVNRVTFWGVTDASSWKNDFPIPGRKDYALPIDREGNLKDIL